MDKKDEIAIWVITPGGVEHGVKLLKGLPGSTLFLSRRIADECFFSFTTGTAKDEKESGTMEPTSAVEKVLSFEKLSLAMAKEFKEYYAHICIFSTGIAVRMIAPFLESKVSDPAVVVMDDCACHAISLVSGHLGGGNELAVKVSRISGATPVITTATDVNGLPSIDMIAKSQNLFIENPGAIKHVNMAFLQDRKVRVVDPLQLITPYIPERFVEKEISIAKASEKRTAELNSEPMGSTGLEQENIAGVICSDETVKVSRETLILRPPSLVAGMGCNRNTSQQELTDFLRTSFEANGLSLNSLVGFATTRVKQDEEGLLRMAETLGKTITFYDKDELNSVKMIQNPSEMVEKHLGVKSVCEAAAILAAHNGKLILPKIKKGNATLAVARIGANFL